MLQAIGMSCQSEPQRVHYDVLKNCAGKPRT